MEHQKLALLKALTDPAIMHVSKAVIFEMTNSMEWKEQVSLEEVLCETQTEPQTNTTTDSNVLVAIKVLDNVKAMLQFIKKPGKLPNDQERFIRIAFTLISGGEIEKI